MDTNTWLLIALFVVIVGGFLWIKKGDQSSGTGNGEPTPPSPEDESRG